MDRDRALSQARTRLKRAEMALSDLNVAANQLAFAMAYGGETAEGWRHAHELNEQIAQQMAEIEQLKAEIARYTSGQ